MSPADKKNLVEERQQLVNEVLEAYPEKAKNTHNLLF